MKLIKLLITALVSGSVPVQVSKDIVDVAIQAGSFNTLVTALKEAGLVDVLRGEGPFTVFAPNDDAFKKLPAGMLEKALKDKSLLTNILKYHVVSGKHMAADVVGKQSVKTIQGGSLPVSSGPKIGDARIIKTDINCRNGVIHVIDTVLIPK